MYVRANELLVQPYTPWAGDIIDVGDNAPTLI